MGEELILIDMIDKDPALGMLAGIIIVTMMAGGIVLFLVDMYQTWRNR